VTTVRRAYLYLAAGVSGQAVAWAVIVLLRGLCTAGRANTEAIAFGAAMAIVATPIYLAHWLLVQRGADDGAATAQAARAREIIMRAAYLFGMIALFLIPAMASAFDAMSLLLDRVLGGPMVSLIESVEAFGVPAVDASATSVDLIRTGTMAGAEVAAATHPSTAAALAQSLVILLVLALAIAYHARLVAGEAGAIAASSPAAAIRRIFVLGFSLLGLTLAAVAAVQLIRWILLQSVGPNVEVVNGAITAVRESSRLLVGLAAWLVFWSLAQRLARDGGADERRSALRSLYVYGVLFVSVVAFLAPTAMIVAGLFRAGLGLPQQGNIAGPLPVMLITAVLWAYHARVLRDDARREPFRPRQAAIRRVYVYLLSFVGLLALVASLASLVQVVAWWLVEGDLHEGLMDQLIWSAAIALTSLPLWAGAWRRAQLEASRPGEPGRNERTSTPRRLYVAFFLFLSTVLFLTGAVYVVFRVISAALAVEATPSTLQHTAAATGYCVIGALVWLYHGFVLRADGRRSAEDRDTLLGKLDVVVLDDPQGAFGEALIDALAERMPAVDATLVPITAKGGEELHAPGNGPRLRADVGPEGAVESQLDDATVIVMRASALIAPEGDRDALAQVVAAAERSSALKLVVPDQRQGWSWSGVERRDLDTSIDQVLHALLLVADGREVAPWRPPSTVVAVGVLLVVILMLLVVAVSITGIVLLRGLGQLFQP